MFPQFRPVPALRKLPPSFARLQARMARLEAEFALWRKAAGAFALGLGRLYPDLFTPDTPQTGRPATVHQFPRPEEEARHE